MKKRKRPSHKDRLLEQSNQFLAFSRLFQQGAEQAERKAEKERVLAKVCHGLHEVCKMLAAQRE